MKKLLLLHTMLFFFLVVSSQSKVDSLLQQCEKAKEKQKASIYLELSFHTRKDTARSNSYTLQAFNLAVKNNQVPEQAKALYYLGENHYYSRSFAEAIPQYERAIPLFEQLRDTFYLTNCYNSIGLCFHSMFQGEKAIENFIKGLKLCEKDQEYTAELISNIAMAHVKMNNHRDAINNYRKALAINTSIKDSSSMAVNFNGIGDTFLNMHKPDSALINFLKAHHFFKKIKNKAYEAITLANVASIYPNYPDSLNKSLDYFNQSWAIFKELGLNHYEADIKEGIGNVLHKQGKYREALTAFNESLQLTDKFNRGFALKKSNYKALSEVYKSMGDYKSALENHELFAIYSDSLDQKEKYDQIVNLEKQYETEKKENEIIRLRAKQELTNVQLQKNKQFKQLGFVTISLLLIFIFFILMKYFDKMKSNQILAEKNQQIEQSEKELRNLNVAKNKFFSIIAHDLKNPFHSVMGYSYLLSKDYDHFSESERKKFAVDIHQSTNNIYRLLENLLEWSGTQTGRVSFAPCRIKFKRVLENSVNVLFSQAEQKNIGIQFDYDEELILFADPRMIETVLRNLVNNAIKFTPENGQIKISAKQDGDMATIRIDDSGTGMPEEDVVNLFRIDSKVRRKGTNNEDGSGLGLILCKEFVTKNMGAIWANSILGKGSSFIFTLPAKSQSEATNGAENHLPHQHLLSN